VELLLGMASPDEYVPAGQDRQVSAVEAETVEEYFPAGHAVQYSAEPSRPYRYSSSNSRLLATPASLFTTKPM
jgi:hypothetical protein